MRKPLPPAARAASLGAVLLLVPPVAHAAQKEDQKSEEQKLVDDAARTVERMKGDPGLMQSELLRKAKAVFIMPREQIGGTVVRLGTSSGVLLGHRNDSWSAPAFYNVGSLFTPHRNGGDAGPLVLLLMSDKAVDRFLKDSDVSVGTGHGLKAVPDAPGRHDEAADADIVEWGGATGGFSGQEVRVSGIAQNSASDRDYYGRKIDAEEILRGKASNPGADKLRQDLSGPG